MYSRYLDNMNPEPFQQGSREPLSLLSISTRWTALLPYLDSHFKASVDHTSSANSTLKIELAKDSNSKTTYSVCSRIKSLFESPSPLSIEYRRAQRFWYSQIMQWGNKHDTVIKLASDVGYRLMVKDLVFSDDMSIDDRQTALNLVTFQAVKGQSDTTSQGNKKTCRFPPEEVRLTMAALHCIDEYFLLKNQGSRLSQQTVRQAANFIVTVHHLWQGGALPHEKKKWFRKLAHKGFYDLCHKILKQQDMSMPQISNISPARTDFEPEVNELLMIYVHSLAGEPDHPIRKLIEVKKHWSRQFIAS